ncbi:helix-turn-helix domain-containing protein [Prosthecobacter sp.]|uniref:helix-turn-helix domain-containing protein n=1 Tax=Prosthecobacter sp. TaxID=1965333 RepID=UPI003784ABC8
MIAPPPPFLFFAMGENDTSEEQTKKRGRGRPAGAVQLYTVQQVVDLLSLTSVQTVYTWTRQACADGKPVLPVVKLGRFVRIKETDLAKLSERLAARRPSSFFSGCE